MNQNRNADPNSEGVSALVQRLEEAEQRYQELFEFGPDGHLLTDTRGLIIQANRAASAMLDVDRESLIGKPLARYVAEEDRDALFLKLAQVTEPDAGKGKTRLELSIQPRNRECFHAAMVAGAMYEGGDLVGVRWSLRDVTQHVQKGQERLLAEAHKQRQAAEEANRLLQALIQTMPIGAIIADADGKLLATNTVGRAILGGPVDGSVTHPEREYTPHYVDGTPFPSKDMPLMRALKEGRTVRDVEILIRREDGEERAILASAAPVLNRSGEIVSGITVFQDISNSKRAEAALRESEQQFRTLADFTYDWEYWLGPDGEYVYVSPSCERITGHPAQAFISDPRLLLEIAHPDDRDAVEAHFAEETKGGESRFFDFRIITADGQERWINHACQPVHAADGEWLGWRGSNRDVSDRKRAEAARERLLAEVQDLAANLERERAKLQAIIENAPEGIVVADDRGRITLTNSAADRLLARPAPIGDGYESHGELGLCRPDGTAIPPRDLPLTRAALDGETHRGEELAIVWPSGEQRDLLVDTAPIQSRKGKISGAIGVFRDITERQRVEERLRVLHEQVRRDAEELEQLVAKRTAQLEASEARFRAIFEQSALGIALLDKRGRVMATNAALQRMLGRGDVGLTGEVFARFAHPDEDIARELMTYRQMATGARDYHRVETRYVDADDDVRWANLVLSLVRDRAGEPDFVIAIVEDVTESKQAQAALVQSEKLAMTGRLAASLAHEVNNPLQTVIGCLGLAEESLAEGDGEDLEQYITMAHEELRRAARIVSRLRDLSRPTDVDAGEPSDVNALVERVLALSRKELENRHIEVALDLPEGLPQPVLAPDRMQQVFLNLVLNAADAMPEGGQLRVMTRYDGPSEEVLVTFIDDGPGIPPNVRPSIFDPFFSTKAGGLGLGLFVSQNIVQEHGGRIEVETELGHGATFRVRLPV